MAKDKRSRIIALSGISCAFAVICVTASYYVDIMTLTFSVLSAVAISLPFTRGYLTGGVLAFVSASIISFFIANINAIPFIVFFGAYELVRWLIEFKLMPRIYNKPLKYAVAYILKLAYLEIAVAIIWFAASSILPILIIFGKEIKLTYLIFSLGSIPIFLLYDLMMHLIFINEQRLLKRVFKDSHVVDRDENAHIPPPTGDIFGDKSDSDGDDSHDDTLDDFMNGR